MEDEEYVPLNVEEDVFDPIYSLISRPKGYGDAIIMTDTFTWEETIMTISEFSERHWPPSDYTRFISIARKIVGFDPFVFFMTLIEEQGVKRDVIPQTYISDIESYIRIRVDKDELKSLKLTPDFLNSRKDKILHFDKSLIVYTSLIFSSPDIDEEFFDDMDITEGVVSIMYSRGEKKMYKQTVYLTKEDIDVIASRGKSTKQYEEDGLLILMSFGLTTVNVKVSNWHVEISSSSDINIVDIVNKLSNDWMINVEYIFISSATYTMVMKDIQYEKIMYYWGLSKSKKYRDYIDVKETNTIFWDKLDVSSEKMNYIVTPEHDQYSYLFKTGVSVSAFIFGGNSYRPKYQHQPSHMDRLLKMRFRAANEEHARYIMFYLANSIKEIMSNFEILKKELTKLLVGVYDDNLVYPEYLMEYTKRLLDKKIQSGDKIFKLSEHNKRQLSKYADTKIFESYNNQCDSKSKPLITDVNDADIWEDALFDIKQYDDRLYVCPGNKPIRELTITIADMSYTFHCCKSSIRKKRIEEVAEVENFPAEFMHSEIYPVRRRLSNPTVFNFLNVGRRQIEINMMFVHIPNKFLLILCIDEALNLEERDLDPWQMIMSSNILKYKSIRMDLSGKIFLDHIDLWEFLEEVFEITLVIFELSDITRRNKTLGRPIVFLNCVRNAYKQPFYYLITFSMSGIESKSISPKHVLYDHFSRALFDLAITNKANNGTTEPIKHRYIQTPKGKHYPTIMLRLREDRTFIVVRQVLNIEGNRVMSIINIPPNEEYRGPSVYGLVYHAASAPFNVQIEKDATRYFISSDIWIAYGVEPNMVSKHSIIHEGVGNYVFVCDVHDELIQAYPVVDDPKFISIGKGNKEIDRKITNIKDVESMNRLMLNILAQTIILTGGSPWDIIVSKSNVKIESWTRNDYFIAKDIDELFEVADQCLTYTVDDVIHSSIESRTIVFDKRLDDDIDYFVEYIISRSNRSDARNTLELSLNADKYFYETDYRQDEGIITLASLSNLWMYSDSLLNNVDRATMYISPNLSIRDTPYKLKVGDDVFFAYNVVSEQEAEWVIDYYEDTGQTPEREDIAGVSLVKHHDVEYVEYRISNARDTKVATLSEDVSDMKYKILHYPMRYSGYKLAALLTI